MAEQRTAYLGFFGEINAQSVQKFLALISQKTSKSTKELYIFIGTNGGSVDYGFALYNMLRALPYTISMHNVGSVDSIGNIVFLAGKKRLSVDNGTFLIHGVTNSVNEKNAKKDFLCEKLDSLMSSQEKIRKILKDNSRLTTQELDRLMQSGQVKDSGFALEKGIIHKISDAEVPSGHTLLVVETSDSDDN